MTDFPTIGRSVLRCSKEVHELLLVGCNVPKEHTRPWSLVTRTTNFIINLAMIQKACTKQIIFYAKSVDKKYIKYIIVIGVVQVRQYWAHL